MANLVVTEAVGLVLDDDASRRQSRADGLAATAVDEPVPGLTAVFVRLSVRAKFAREVGYESAITI